MRNVVGEGAEIVGAIGQPLGHRHEALRQAVKLLRAVVSERTDGLAPALRDAFRPAGQISHWARDGPDERHTDEQRRQKYDQSRGGYLPALLVKLAQDVVGRAG